MQDSNQECTFVFFYGTSPPGLIWARRNTCQSCVPILLITCEMPGLKQKSCFRMLHFFVSEANLQNQQIIISPIAYHSVCFVVIIFFLTIYAVKVAVSRAVQYRIVHDVPVQFLPMIKVCHPKILTKQWTTCLYVLQRGHLTRDGRWKSSPR